MSELLGPRALNRAILERQLLLRRSHMPVLTAVEHLVGLQAQLPLKSVHGALVAARALSARRARRAARRAAVVRTVVMRATIHLVTADDCLLLRPLMQPVLDGELARHPEFAPALEGVDLDTVLAFARPLLDERPRTARELRAELRQRFPDHHDGALAYACRNHLALVQVPPRGVWGRTAQVTSATAEAWLGRLLASAPSLDEVALRYLAAFGPAGVADAATWSRLTGLGAVFDRLRPRLRTFRDERGRELFDLPDAPRPGPDVPAPPRFLPEYDNVLLSHADRSRFITEGLRGRLSLVSGPVHGSVLRDGLVCGLWRLDRDRATRAATLVVSHVPGLTKRAIGSLAAEGRRLLRFLAADADGLDVRFVAIE